MAEKGKFEAQSQLFITGTKTLMNGEERPVQNTE